jgi:hypothetical protein
VSVKTERKTRNPHAPHPDRLSSRIECSTTT